MDAFDTEIAEKLLEVFRIEQSAEAFKREALTAEMYARQLRMEIKDLMEAQGVMTMESQGFVLSVKRKPLSVHVTEEDKLPDYVFTTVRKLDLAKVKKAIDSGAPIAGAVLSNGGATTLAIKAKT